MIDNESAFMNSYKMLCDDQVPLKSKIHDFLLKTNCVFRRKTIRRLYALVKSPDPSQLLLR